MIPWKTLLPAFLLGALVGGVVGARCQRAAAHRFWQKGFDAERLTRKLDRELALDAGQEAAVKAVVERHRESLSGLRREAAARFAAARKAMHAELEPLLRDEQKEKLAAMAARWDARRAQRSEPNR